VRTAKTGYAGLFVLWRVGRPAQGAELAQ
jgi:hypothetical protein